MSTSKHETVLRKTLLANALFSGLSGLVALAATDAVAAWMGVERVYIFELGAELMLFGAFVGFLASRDLSLPWVRKAVAAVAALDVLWVVGSVALLLTPGILTVAGQWTVGLVALAVADFAALQIWGWWGMGRTPAVPAPARA
ncbi:MAG: hypothetical protein AAGN66_04450 [Acidobacteriota bacterium]